MLIERLSAPQTLNNAVDDFFLWSKCATEKQEKEYLRLILGNRPLVVAFQIYSGSYHGWMLKNFHQRCDNKGPTICLFKI